MPLPPPPISYWPLRIRHVGTNGFARQQIDVPFDCESSPAIINCDVSIGLQGGLVNANVPARPPASCCQPVDVRTCHGSSKR